MTPGFDVAIFCYPPHRHHLENLINSIHKYVSGYNKIRIIYDDSSQFDDSSVAPFTFENYEVKLHSSIPWSSTLWDNGWIRQQILKLQCHQFSNENFTWVVDSDILIYKTLNLFDPESALPYLRYQTYDVDPAHGCYEFMQRYFGIRSVHPKVIANGAGNCIFDHRVLAEMHDYCKTHNGMCLIDLLESLMSQHTQQQLDQWRGYPFSEFETYGNWVHQNCSNRAIPATQNWASPSQHSVESPEVWVF
jgi:hypothetical protein